MVNSRHTSRLDGFDFFGSQSVTDQSEGKPTASRSVLVCVELVDRSNANVCDREKGDLESATRRGALLFAYYYKLGRYPRTVNQRGPVFLSLCAVFFSSDFVAWDVDQQENQSLQL